MLIIMISSAVQQPSPLDAAPAGSQMFGPARIILYLPLLHSSFPPIEDQAEERS